MLQPLLTSPQPQPPRSCLLRAPDTYVRTYIHKSSSFTFARDKYSFEVGDVLRIFDGHVRIVSSPVPTARAPLRLNLLRWNATRISFVPNCNVFSVLSIYLKKCNAGEMISSLYLHNFYEKRKWKRRITVSCGSGYHRWMKIHDVCMEGWVWREWEYKSGVVWSECLRYFMAEERTNERDVCENMVTKKQVRSGRCPVESWINARLECSRLWELRQSVRVKYMYFVISIKSISN